MTTSQTQWSILDRPSDGKPTAAQFVFFGRRFRNEVHSEVLKRFRELQKSEGFTQAELARRVGKDPAQITRWFSEPKNMEIETISQLLLAMGYVPRIESRQI